MYLLRRYFVSVSVSEPILLIWMIKRLSYDIHDITQRLTLPSRCQGPDSLSEASGDKCAALSVENRSSSSPSCYFDYLSHWETITARFSVIWLILVVRNTWWIQRNRPRWAHLLLGTGRPEEEDPVMSPAATQQHSDECQPLEEESGRSCIQKNWMQRKKYLQTQHFVLFSSTRLNIL